MIKHVFLSSLLISSVLGARDDHGMLDRSAMTEIHAISTQSAPAPVGPFSQAMMVANPTTMLFISGQLPIDPVTNQLFTDPAQAAAQCMKNIQAILQAAHMNFGNVVKTTIFLTDMNDFAVVNQVYAQFVEQPYPARATFQVAALPKGACVEIEMIAMQ